MSENKQNKSDPERQIFHVFPHMLNLDLNSHICNVWDIRTRKARTQGEV